MVLESGDLLRLSLLLPTLQLIHLLQQPCYNLWILCGDGLLLADVGSEVEEERRIVFGGGAFFPRVRIGWVTGEGVDLVVS